MNWNLFRSPALRRAVQALFDVETGHDHDGDNSKILSASAVVGEDSVTTTKIQDDAVTEPKIADDAVTEDKIKVNAVTTPKIANVNVTEAKIAAGAVTEAKIGAGAVVAAKLGTGAVTHEKILADAVREAGIQDDAVTTDKINNLNVTSGKLAAEAVIHGKIAEDAVRAPTIQANAVITAKIANDAVDKDKINADVAGDGLGQNMDGSLELKVDDSTVETNADTLRVKANGITNAQIAAETVRLAEMAGLARGRIIVGGADGKPAALDASTDTQILVADAAGDLKSVAMGTDVALANTGAATIQAGVVTTAKMADLTQGSILRGGADNKVGALAAVTAGHIVYGDGTDVTSSAMTGDGALNGSGELTIADDAVSLAKMDDLARGNIIIGNATDDPSALDVSTAGRILVGDGDDLTLLDASGNAEVLIGNGTTIAGQTLGGDVTMINDGSVTIGAGRVTSAKIDPGVVQSVSVAVSNADIKALHGAGGKQLVTAPGENKYIEFISATLFHNYGTNVLTGDHAMTIGLDSGTIAVAETIAHGDFAHKTANHLLTRTANDIDNIATNVVNKNLALLAAGAYEGNADDDTVWTVNVTYKVHDFS